MESTLERLNREADELGMSPAEAGVYIETEIEAAEIAADEAEAAYLRREAEEEE